MFITKAEYDALVKKAEGKGNEKEIKELKETIETLEKDKETMREDRKREVANMDADCKVLLARKDAEVETKIANETKTLNEEISTLTIEKNNAVQKAEILETAFKNLGFDVKDMKGILNKLVDGLIAKNQIQLINSK